MESVGHLLKVCLMLLYYISSLLIINIIIIIERDSGRVTRESISATAQDERSGTQRETGEASSSSTGISELRWDTRAVWHCMMLRKISVIL